jgi:hypothetical protein
MSSKKSVVRVFDSQNPSFCEYSQTNNVAQRLKAIRQDIELAQQGQGHPRWQPWQHVPRDRISVEIFRPAYKARLSTDSEIGEILG